MNITDGLSGDWWLKGDMQTYNEMKNVIASLSMIFFSGKNIYNELDNMWYFDNTTLIKKQGNKEVEDCKGMTNAEVLILIMDEFNFEYFFPNIKEYLERYANSNDLYYKNSAVWKEWKRLLK